MNDEQIKEVMRLVGDAVVTNSLFATEQIAATPLLDKIDKISAERDALAAKLAEPTFQQRVQPWMLACFGAEIAADKVDRNHRFLEEALELVQATGCTAGEAHQLVDYVYGRPVGDPPQEVGGVKVTLAALCLAHGIDMHSAAETELARIWTKVEQIRAKQAAKPKHSPLPEHVDPAPNAFPLNPNAASKWAHLQKHDGAEAIGVVFRTGSGSVGSLVDGRVVWADWLAHPEGGKPESVNGELLVALKAARELMQHSESCGDSPTYNHEPDACGCGAEYAIDFIESIIARAESAIKSSPKPVSPDLLESARAVVARWDAPTWKDLPATAEYVGRLRVAIAQADLDGALTAEEWVVKNVSGSAGLVRAMVIRAEAEESAIETPAKVSPCAGHAVQQEADERSRVCWSCKTPTSAPAISESDGNCPFCGVEICQQEADEAGGAR